MEYQYTVHQDALKQALSRLHRVEISWHAQDDAHVSHIPSLSLGSCKDESEHSLSTTSYVQLTATTGTPLLSFRTTSVGVVEFACPVTNQAASFLSCETWEEGEKHASRTLTRVSDSLNSHV